jgi:hypothetical protein
MKTCHLSAVIAGLCMVFIITVPVLAADAPAIQWQNVLGGSLDDIPYSINQTADGGFIVVGSTVSADSGAAGSGNTVPYPGSGGVITGLGSLLIAASYDAGDFTKAQKYTIRVESAVGRVVTSTTTGAAGYASADRDILVMKLDSSGTLQWLNVYGSNYDDEGYGIRQTSDGGYVLAGYTEARGNRDALVIRLDSAGNVVWQKVLGGRYADFASDIRQTGDNGFIVVGTTYSSNSGDVGVNHGSGDIWVIRMDPSGTIVWQKLLGGYGDDNGYSIHQTIDGGYVLTGNTYSDNSGDVGPNHGSDDMWVVKLDSVGNIQWQKVLGGNAHEAGYGVRQTHDGGYVAAGVTGSSNNGDVGASHGNGDFWVVRLDSSGNIQWQKVLGGSDVDNGRAIEQTSDGGYILTGYSTSGSSGDVGPNHNSCDAWVVRLDSVGTVLWQRQFGGFGTEWGLDIHQTRDGGYVFTGQTDSSNSGDVGLNHGRNDFWVVKLAPEASSPFPLFPTTIPRIPSIGQATTSYQVGFDGLMYNVDGKNTLDIDLAKARRSLATVSVYQDRVEVYQRDPDGVLITFRGSTFTLQGDRISGPVTSADLVTDPVEAPLTPGTVSGSVWAVLPELTQRGTLKTTISDTPSSSLVDLFRSILEQNGLVYDTVAYIFDIRKSSMPRSANASVNLTLPESWVKQHGGTGLIRIIRISDSTGAAELLPIHYTGTDRKGMMHFEGISVNGTSVFGLITLKASKMAQENDPGLKIESGQQPAITTFVSMIIWLMASVQQNPAGAIAVVVCACATYAGRKRGMW